MGLVTFSYRATCEHIEGRFLIRFPDFSWGVTDGSTIEEALKEGSDCLTTLLISTMNDKKDIPKPTPVKMGELEIAPNLLIALKATLYQESRDRGLRQVDLQKLLETNQKEVARILDPRHNTRIDRLIDALGKTGVNIVLARAA